MLYGYREPPAYFVRECSIREKLYSAAWLRGRWLLHQAPITPGDLLEAVGELHFGLFGAQGLGLKGNVRHVARRSPGARPTPATTRTDSGTSARIRHQGTVAALGLGSVYIHQIDSLHINR